MKLEVGYADDGSLESSRLRQSSRSGKGGVGGTSRPALEVHESANRVKKFGSDPIRPPGKLKPEQQEIERLRREVSKLKTERDILKNCHGPLPACAR